MDEHQLICVQTLDFQVHVLEACDKRDDEWSNCICARFENVKDLYVIYVIAQALRAWPIWNDILFACSL